MLDAQPEQQSEFTLASVGLGTRVLALDYLYGDLAVALPLRNGAATHARRLTAVLSVKAEF